MEPVRRTLVLIAIVVLGVVGRLLFVDLPNFAPVGALALFAGASFADRRVAMVLPLVVMLLTDWIIGLHSTVLYVYAGMLAYVAFGMWAGNQLKLTRLIPAALAGSVCFFLLTNFGVYLANYPRTMAGLIECYSMALPFFDRTVMSDLFFGGIAFGVLAVAQKVSPGIRPSVA